MSCALRHNDRTGRRGRKSSPFAVRLSGPLPDATAFARLRRMVAVLLLPLLSLTASAQSRTVDLRDITVTPLQNGATISFLLSGRVATVVIEPRRNGVAEVRMKSIAASSAALNSALPKPGVVSIRAHVERRDVLVTDVAFKREVTGLSVLRRDTERVVVHVALGNQLSAAVLASSSPSSSGSPPTTTTAEPYKRKWSLSTIVIDAGHGGKDPGALGIGEIKEKDITLAVALKLRDEIRRQLPGVKVVMTRDDDRFIELYRRGQIANQADGKLFLSIHCNSMPEKPHPASGFECYILRPGKSADAARVAAAENGAIRFESNKDRYKGMETESAIVASMAQSAFARYSEMLAGAVRRAMRADLSIPDRGVHQAGFYVLVGASMPGALIEIGYLSNEQDARKLADSKGQAAIAKAICNGIRAYEKLYSASLR